MQALTISDSAASASSSVSPQSDSVCQFLSPQLTPSLTFSEFSLMCAHMLSAEDCSAVRRLMVQYSELVHGLCVQQSCCLLV